MYTVVTAISASNVYTSVINQNLNFLPRLVLSSYMNLLKTSNSFTTGKVREKSH